MGERELKKIHYFKRKYKKTKKVIMSGLASRFHIILYCFGFAVGIVLIALSFFLKDNWINVSSGVGTGLLTSLVVSIAINYGNDKRQKRKLLQDKKLVLRDIIDGSIDVYSNLLYKINEYIMLNNIPLKSFYGFYDDFSSYNEFEDYLKKTGYK
jgi:ABC-type transport system involved in multi-copper enzyme maturation permease subunit